VYTDTWLYNQASVYFCISQNQ